MQLFNLNLVIHGQVDNWNEFNDLQQLFAMVYPSYFAG